MKVKAQVVVSGMVKGVFFRLSIRSRAKMLGLRGWVRNTGDDVEALLQGEKEDIEKVIEFCRQGPSGAVVENVSVEWSDPEPDLTGFEIRE